MPRIPTYRTVILSDGQWDGESDPLDLCEWCDRSVRVPCDNDLSAAECQFHHMDYEDE